MTFAGTTPEERTGKADVLLPPPLARKLETLELGSRLRRPGQLRGDRRSTKRGSSVEFADYRTYAPGDDLRRVDWNLYARTDRLFLKVYEEEEDRAVHLLVDTSASMGFGSPTKLTTAVRLAATLGYVALNGLDRLQLIEIGSKNRPRPWRGTGAVPAMLGYLSGLAPGGENALSRTLKEYAGSTKQVGLLILISDLLDPAGVGEGLRALGARGHEISVIQVLSPEELQPELSGDLELLDSESGQRQSVTLDGPTLDAYQRRLDEWLAEIRQTCAGVGASYNLVRSDATVENELFGALRASKVLVS